MILPDGGSVRCPQEPGDEAVDISARLAKEKARYSSCGVENNFLTDSRESTTIVNTPSIVPKGTKRHSMQAITSANE